MKRILILVFTMIIALGLSLSVYAEEIASDTVVPEDTYTADEVDSVEDEKYSTSFDTVLTRLLEWWDVNKAEIIAAAGFIGAAILTFLWNKIKKFLTDIVSKIISLISSTNASTDNIKSLIKGYNGQTDEISALRGELSETKRKLESANNKLEEVEELIGHIAHILTTVYTNSKALPQGVRDMVNIECAHCMKLVDLGASDSEVVSDEVKEEN